MKITLVLIASLAFVLGGVPHNRFDPCIFIDCTKEITSAKSTTKPTTKPSTQGTTPKSAATTDPIKKDVSDKEVASDMVIVFLNYLNSIFLVKLKLSF